MDAAVALLGERGEDASVLAGGHSLLPLMKLRFAAPELLIAIGRLEDRQHLEVILLQISSGDVPPPPPSPSGSGDTAGGNG